MSVGCYRVPVVVLVASCLSYRSSFEPTLLEIVKAVSWCGVKIGSPSLLGLRLTLTTSYPASPFIVVKKACHTVPSDVTTPALSSPAAMVSLANGGILMCPRYDRPLFEVEFMNTNADSE